MNNTIESGQPGPNNYGAPGTEMLIDPQFQGARTRNVPLDYMFGGRVLGQYRASFVTGVTVSIAAGGILAYLRNDDKSTYIVVQKITASVAVAAAITAATVADLAAFIGRGSTAVGSGGNALTLAVNNKKRRIMGDSILADVRVATTGALTRPTTAAADAQPFAAAAFPLKVSPDIGATAATGVAVGVASPIIELYKPDVQNGEHPIVLSLNEHVELQQLSAGPVTGGLKWYLTIDWAEVAAY
jgi:hypothetical protein